MTTFDADAVFRVDLLLDTLMWNEGFEQAETPWLRLYTSNASWAQTLPPLMSVDVPHEAFPQQFIVSVAALQQPVELPDSEETEWVEQHTDEHDGEIACGHVRFAGMLDDLSGDELTDVVNKRLSQWGGV